MSKRIIEFLEPLRRGLARRPAHHHLLLAGAYTLDILVIHPFADGNGRMSRLLLLPLLYRGGYEVGRSISVEKLLEESKATSDEALAACTEHWHQGEEDLRPWLSYVTPAYREFEPQQHDGGYWWEPVVGGSGRSLLSWHLRRVALSGVAGVWSARALVGRARRC